MRIAAVGAIRLMSARIPRGLSADPPVLAAAAGVLVLVTVIAASIPAFRATRVQPSLALRSE